jgi:flagellar biosynthesis activator protein FlaF
MYSSQTDVYKEVQKTSLTDRQLEAAVLMKAAAMLKRCQTNWNAADRDQQLEKALRYNQLLWSFFQSALANPENPLPQRLKEDILRLSMFIDQRIFEVMSYPSPEKITIIIDINTNLAEGLRANA